MYEAGACFTSVLLPLVLVVTYSSALVRASAIFAAFLHVFGFKPSYLQGCHIQMYIHPIIEAMTEMNYSIHQSAV